MDNDQSQPTSVINGEDKTILFWVSDQDNHPFDLTGATEIDVEFPSTDTDGCFHKLLSLSQVAVINAGGGNFSVPLAGSDTAKLLVGIQSVEASITIAGKVSKVQFESALNVKESLFPNC